MVVKDNELLRIAGLGIGLFALVVGFFAGAKHAKADDLPVVYKNGTLASSETWSASNVYFLTGQLTIPDGVTLTIPAGTIIKVNYHTNGIRVNSGGSLDVNGSTSNRVIFTSYRDDSMGGDTNGDGQSVGAYFDYTAISSDGGSVVLTGADFRFTSDVLTQDCDYNVGSVSITDSLIDGSVSLTKCDQGQVLVQRNQFSAADESNSPALKLYNTTPIGIDVVGINKNTFMDSARAIQFSASSDYNPLVPVNEAWEFSSSNGAILLISSAVINGTLNVSAGSIIKIQYHEDGLKVSDTGQLNIQGVATNPVRVTSYKDDSIGGDTNGDGHSSLTPSDYNHGIINNGGAIAVRNASFTGGSRSIQANCNYAVNSATTLEDNNFNGAVGLDRCNPNTVSLKRNLFSLPDELGIFAMDIYNTPPTGLILTGANKNTFMGTGIRKVIRIGTSSDFTPLVPSGESWTLDSAGGAVLQIYTSKIEGTLNINAGSIIKVNQFGEGFKVVGSGQLNIYGTAALPVYITSYKDDTLGGDSNGDGNSTPSFSDFNRALSVINSAVVDANYLHIGYTGNAISLQGGESDFSHTTISSSASAVVGIEGTARFDEVDISDAQYGLDVRGADISYRGTFNNIASKYIRSCNWGSSCNVDAAYVDWGDDNGPFTAPGVYKACGSVTVSPWNVGSSFTGVSAPFDIPNCDNSPTPVDEFVAARTAAQQQVAQRRIDCNNGLQDACDAIANTFGCLGAAIQLAASQSPIPVTFDNPTETVDMVGQSMAEAADTAIRAVEVEHPPAFSLTVATKVLGVVNLYNALTDAYDSCSP